MQTSEKNPLGKTINEEKFCELLCQKLTKLNKEIWERALSTFKKFGPNLSSQVTKVFLCAADQEKKKVIEVLSILEEHYENHLFFQYPEIRGLDIKTEIKLKEINQKLGLPTEETFSGTEPGRTFY